MNILAITQHSHLLERLRTAFEGAGHRVTGVPDHLQALALEAWDATHLILVDAVGDPMDGYRLCNLLRAESRVLFRNLPIFLILDHPPEEEDRSRLLEADGDGFVETDCSIHKLGQLLGPLMEGTAARLGGPQVTLLACGLPEPISQRIAEVVKHYGFNLQTTTPRELPGTVAHWRPPLLFLGAEGTGEAALELLRELPNLLHAPYPILVGNLTGEAEQRKLLTAGTMDWLGLPLSAPVILHVVRRAMEWLHAKRIQREYHAQINDLVERRTLLEMEAAALRSEVLTDPLTGLLNRRAFKQNLDHALNQWERHRRAFVLVLGDLDYFKLINDRFGHVVGDKVLKLVAQRIRASLRRSDLAFRIGGEEFAILLSETSLTAGVDVADKIRHRIDQAPVTLESGQTVFPTMSFGIGGPEGGEAKDLFVRVDQALYAAKHKGRNRVELAD